MKQHEEKVRELVEKFKRLETDYEDGDTAGMTDIGLATAKQCALIVANDRLEEIEISLDMDTFVKNTSLWNYQVDKQKEWQQVKTEINKL